MKNFRNIISYDEFQSLCGKYLIDVGVALEHPFIMSCLSNQTRRQTKNEKEEILFDIEETLRDEF